MALLGNGVAAIWHNVAPEAEADYDHWHCHEHMAERVAIPGFLRGRRYVAVAAERKFFHFYETETLASLMSKAYLDRLNNPTPWTQRIVPSIHDNNRTLCNVVSTQGKGGGAAILTCRFSPAEGHEKSFTGWLVEEVFPALASGPGIVGAHLLSGDREASQTETEEKALREHADEIADWVFLIEAIEPSYLEALVENQLSDAALEAQGARNVTLGLYRFHYELSSHELQEIGAR